MQFLCRSSGSHRISGGKTTYTLNPSSSVKLQDWIGGGRRLQANPLTADRLRTDTICHFCTASGSDLRPAGRSSTFDSGLFHEQDGDPVPDGIDASASGALEAVAILALRERIATCRANQDFKKLPRDHGGILLPLSGFGALGMNFCNHHVTKSRHFDEPWLCHISLFRNWSD
jgi:hypothetical protein